MVDGSAIDHEKIGKMTKDASFDNSDTKAVLAAISHMFRSAARFDCDDEVFSNEIGLQGQENFSAKCITPRHDFIASLEQC
jgi:hypothetical protein